MPTLTIRNVDDDLKASLRVRAALNGHSMEEEVRSILRTTLAQPQPAGGLGQRLAARFKSVATEVPLPRRRAPRKSPDWRDPS